jgi:hypothetical protein
MCISFVIIGSLLVRDISWTRVYAVVIIYALALGVAAHVADSLGSRKAKPWGNYFSKKQLILLMSTALVIAYGIGVYYIIFFVPLLASIAIVEGFFLFAYNYELFNGFFHSNFWFAVSWGSMPVLAGYIMQTNSVDDFAVMVAIITGLLSYIEIKLSRPYKQMKLKNEACQRVRRFELALIMISLGTITFTLGILTFRIMFQS